MRLALELGALGAWALVVRSGQSGALPRTLVWSGGIAVLSVAALRSPVGSQDVWSYVMEGRMLAIHHASPYIHRPADYGGDRFVELIPAGWRSSRSPYGPLFVAVSAVGALMAGNSVLSNRLVHQGMAALALLGASALHEHRGRATTPAYLLLNPVCLAIVNGGHNDLLVGVLLTVAIDVAVHAATDRHRGVSCGALLSAAVLIKLTALVPVVVVLVWLVRTSRRAALAASFTIVAFTTLAYAAAGGRPAFMALAAGRSRVSRASFAGITSSLFSSSHAGLARGAPLAAALIGVVVGVVLVGKAARRTRGATPTAAATRAVTTFLSTAPFVLPWYAGWALPMAGEAPASRSSRGLNVVATALFLAYTEAPGSSAGPLSRVLACLPVLGMCLFALWTSYSNFRRASGDRAQDRSQLADELRGRGADDELTRRLDEQGI